MLEEWFQRRKAQIASMTLGKTGLSKEAATEFMIRNFLSEKRKRVRKISCQGRGGKQNRRAGDRIARDSSRRLKRKMMKAAGLVKTPFHGPFNRIVLTGKFRPSPLLDSLLHRRAARWKHMVRRRLSDQNVVLRVKLSEFDMLRHPEKTLAQIARIAEAECEELHAYLDFEDQHANDAGAYLVLAEVWPQLNPIFAGGMMPRPIQKVLAATGLDHELGIHLTAGGDHTDVWPFRIERRRKRGTTTDPDALLKPQDADKVTRDFVNTLNEWLAVPNDPNNDMSNGYELTGEGKAHITDLLGELLCNAERHSIKNSEDGDWSVTGFMARRERKGQYDLKCHIAFLSVGQSIAQSLQSASSNVRADIDQYVNSHKSCGLSIETLSTVVALQDSVTGSAEADDATRGGMGLQDVLQVVDELAEFSKDALKGEVTIVSGNSCIQLAAPNLFMSHAARPYAEQDNDGGKLNERRLHWCNEENKRNIPPDRRFVHDMEHFFAGTLVSVAFALNNDYVDSLELENDDDNYDRD